MIYKAISISLVAICLATGAFSQQQGSAASARKFKDVTEFGCCGLDMEIDTLIEAIRNEPGARAHVIGYSGPVDPPGKLLRSLRYIEGGLSDTAGDDSHPISVVNGGYREIFSIELWIIPKGAHPPDPTPSITTKILDYQAAPVLFDKSDAMIMEGGDYPPYLAFDLHCGLGYPTWEEYFRILREEPGIKGQIAIYLAHQDKPKKVRRLERFLRAELKEHHPEYADQITMKYAGKREWSQIELWCVPEGETNPSVTSGAKTDAVQGANK